MTHRIGRVRAKGQVGCIVSKAYGVLLKAFEASVIASTASETALVVHDLSLLISAEGRGGLMEDFTADPTVACKQNLALTQLRRLLHSIAIISND